MLAAALAPRLASATGLKIRKIETVITPQAALVAAERAHQVAARPLSPETARRIESAARTIDHAPLRDALQRLARHNTGHDPEVD